MIGVKDGALVWGEAEECPLEHVGVVLGRKIDPLRQIVRNLIWN